MIEKFCRLNGMGAKKHVMLEIIPSPLEKATEIYFARKYRIAGNKKCFLKKNFIAPEVLRKRRNEDFQI